MVHNNKNSHTYYSYDYYEMLITFFVIYGDIILYYSLLTLFSIGYVHGIVY